MPEPDDSRMTVMEHLEALRRVLIVICIAWGIATIAGWFVGDEVYRYVVHRAGVGQVIIISPTGGFFVRFKVALYVGFLIAAPIIIQQVWSFVGPGLYLHERRLFGPLVFATLFFFALGIGFSLFSLPLIMHVLTGFAPSDVVKPLFDANEFLGFVLGLVIAFGIVFELPVVLYALGRMGIISSRWLWKNRPYWVVGLGLVANFLTPGGDPITPLILFVPLYIFYEGSAILLRISGH
jgi:sec-independent protein translocase protein TatC